MPISFIKFSFQVAPSSTGLGKQACFPSPVLLGATWNENLIKEIGIATAEEAIFKDVDVLLAPTINLHRHPLGGRHFECYSEDPVLTSKIAIFDVRTGSSE